MLPKKGIGLSEILEVWYERCVEALLPLMNHKAVVFLVVLDRLLGGSLESFSFLNASGSQVDVATLTHLS